MDDNIKNSCRICRATSGKDEEFSLLLLESQEETTPNEVTALGELYEELFNLKIDLDADAEQPICICEKCYEKMKEFKEFKSKAEQTMKDLADNPIPKEDSDGEEYEECRIENDLDEENPCSEEDQVESFDVSLDNTKKEDTADWKDKLDMSFREYSEELYQTLNKEYIDVQSLELSDDENSLLVPLNDSKIVDKDSIDASSISKPIKTIRRSRKTKKFECTQCSRTFHTQENLLLHKRLHLGLAPFACSLCERTFKQKVHMKYHMMKHNEQFNFACEECNKSYIRKSDFDMHMRSRHLNQRNYECNVCHKTYLQLEHLKSHRIKHFAGDKSFECKDCSQKFSSANSLRLHERTIHLQELHFQCDICLQEFRRKHHLDGHMNVHKKKPNYKKKSKAFQEPNKSLDPVTEFNNKTNISNHMSVTHDTEPYRIIREDQLQLSIDENGDTFVILADTDSQSDNQIIEMSYEYVDDDVDTAHFNYDDIIEEDEA